MQRLSRGGGGGDCAVQMRKVSTIFHQMFDACEHIHLNHFHADEVRTESGVEVRVGVGVEVRSRGRDRVWTGIISTIFHQTFDVCEHIHLNHFRASTKSQKQ